jgi:integrase
MGMREDEICSLLVEDVRLQTAIQYPPGENGPSEIWYVAIKDSKSESSTRDVPVPTLLLDMGFIESRVLGRDPTEPLFPEFIPQGVGRSRGITLCKRFTEYRKRIGVYQKKVDFHSLRASLATDLENQLGLNPGWADEITGHDSAIRRSVRSLYTKGVRLSLLRDMLDKVRFRGDDRLPRYDGPRGVPAPGATGEIARYVALAEREMRKKAGRRTRPIANRTEASR